MGELVVEVSQIFSHRKMRGRQFLAQISNFPAYEAEWRPLRDFADENYTTNAALYEYIVEKAILFHLQ